jgi:glycosyltransferase involved in cell wall biosynthesis
MRIAFISTLDEALWGGSEELWSRAAITLKQQGHMVMASLAFWRTQSDKVKELVQQGVDVRSHHLRRPGKVKHALKSLFRETISDRDTIKHFNPDLVVISQAFNAGGFKWAEMCRTARVPYVLVVHCNSDLWWFRDDVIDDAITSYINAQSVFCVSESNLKLLSFQVGQPLPNAEVIWSPYNVSNESLPEWPMEAEGYRMACVARLELAAKGQDLLLRTLALPKWRRRGVQLNLFGSGPNEKGLRYLAKMLNLDNVCFRGHEKNVRTIWENHHLLVLPSRYEGLPLALIESMWCGRPAVVTDTGGNAELCVDGETGFISPYATFHSFEETLERAWLSRTNWRQIGNAARERAEAIIPRDPALLFCERIKKCVLEKHVEKRQVARYGEQAKTQNPLKV